MDTMIQASTLIEVLSGMNEDSLEDFLSQYDDEWATAILNHAGVDHEHLDMNDQMIDAVREVILTHY